MKIKNVLTCVIFALLIGGFSVMCILKTPTEYSESERRPLSEMPELTFENVFSGNYMSEFENYATDQVPFREKLKTIKAYFVFDVLNKKDNNSIIRYDGHISKIDEKINFDMLDYAVERFDFIYEKYLKDKDMDIYLSIVPDKNYYLGKDGGYPTLDIEKTEDFVTKKLSYMNYIDIKNLLTKDDYYKTDTHWKQENITHVAEYLAKKMGVDVESEYKVNTLDNPFYGVYAMQSSLKTTPDEIKYLTNDATENCTVTYFDTGIGKKGDVYNMEKGMDKDAYEMFLSGSTPLCVIENDNATSDKELFLFRDSFGSSIAPLLIEGYKKITVIDIRYLKSDYLDTFIDFEKGDVLFLYSSMLLNSSAALQ